MGKEKYKICANCTGFLPCDGESYDDLRVRLKEGAIGGRACKYKSNKKTYDMASPNDAACELFDSAIPEKI